MSRGWARRVGPYAAAVLAFGCAGEVHIRLLEPAESPSTDADGGASADAGAAGKDAALERTIDDLRRAACGRWTTQRQPDQALLMLVVDVSGSMAQPGPDGRRPWDVERPILASTVATMPTTVGLGALYYPNMATTPGTSPRPASACVNVDAGIPLGMLGAPDSRQRTVLQRSLAMTEPNDQAGTPTLDAYLIGLDALGRTTLGGSRQMLLITDGQPTFAEGCVGTGQVDMPVDYTPVVDAVAAAHRAGIDTFVIGSPGSERSFTGGDARPWLSRAAEAGGTALPGCSHAGPRYCHFDMVSEPDFGKGLEDALADISHRIARCDFALPKPPPNDPVDLDALNIVLTSADGTETRLPSEAPTCSSGSGFVFSSDRQRVVLCDDTCELVRRTPGAQLEFLFGCRSGQDG